MRAVPDLLSYTRVCVAAAMLIAARLGGGPAFVLLFFAGILTDLLDGTVARRLGVASEAGSYLDSLADVPFCMAISIGLWWLAPELWTEEGTATTAIILAYAVSVVAGLLRFGRLAALHTWSARASGIIVGVGVVLALAGDPRILHLGAVARVAATAEELAILRMLPEWSPDVGSFLLVRRDARRPTRITTSPPFGGDA